MSEQWPDQQLIGYFKIHSETDRALFHVDQVNQLLVLAGDSRRFPREENPVGMENFMPCHAGGEIDEIIKSAEQGAKP